MENVRAINCAVCGNAMQERERVAYGSRCEDCWTGGWRHAPLGRVIIAKPSAWTMIPRGVIDTAGEVPDELA